MQKCSAFILVACAFALLTTERVAAAPVTWEFIATGCHSDQQHQNSFLVEGCVPTQTYPVTLATLTLPGPDSSGSAVWSGPFGLGLGSPVYTGDSFSLDWALRYRPLTQAFVAPAFPCGGAGQIC